MKALKITAAVFFVALAAMASLAFMGNKTADKKVATGIGKGFAVVELFTSEGCSSCPAADELVAKIQKEVSDKPVYILAFHVDYWNRLGWRDVFSNADYSRRQNDYANYLKIQSVYTPQIVVNGKTEFVGSQEGTLRNAIRTSLGKAAEDQLTLNVTGQTATKAELRYNIAVDNKNTVLLLALVQKTAQTKVRSGENGGRTLSHVQIVRNLQTVKLNGKTGSASIALPHNFDAHGWEVIGFLQNTVRGTITGAAKTDFANADNVSTAKI